MSITISGGATLSGGALFTPPPTTYNGDVSWGTATNLPLRPIASNGNQGLDAVPEVVWDPVNSKVVIFYQDHTNTGDSWRSGYVVVGTISGSGITYGTPVEFANGPSDGQPNTIMASYDANAQKILLTWGTNNNNYARVITVSGTSVTMGSIQQAAMLGTNNFVSQTALVYDSNSQKHVFVYNTSGSDASFARVLTISGTSVTRGSDTRVDSAITSQENNSIVYDSNAQKVVVTYTTNSGNAKAVVGTVSGTSISFGTAVDVTTTGATKTTAVYDSVNQKVVFLWRYNSGGQGAARVGTISGTSLTFGTETIFETDNINIVNDGPMDWAAYDVTSKKVYAVYRNNTATNDPAYLAVGTVSGTDITFGTTTAINNYISYRTFVASTGSLTILAGTVDRTNPSGTLRPYKTYVGTIS